MPHAKGTKMGATPKSLYLDGSSEASALPVRTVQGADAEAQRAARDAIMQIRLFPDLTVALRGALGYGPHVDMLQHFCYWMHPRKPKMQNRWTMYKTYAEWHDECALTDRQVKKGRKVLRDLGLVTEKKGPYGRVHYRVEWVKLAQALSLDGISDQTDDLDGWFDDFEEEISLDGISDQGQFGRHGDQSSLDGISDQPNTGEHAGDYLQETTLVQRAPEPAYAGPGAPEMNGKREEKQSRDVTVFDKRHSQNGHAPSEKQAAKDEVEEPASLAPPKPDDDTLLADVREILDPDSGRWWAARLASKGHTPKKLAEYIANDPDIEHRDLLDSVEPKELEAAIAYVEWWGEEL
jgi:hypothetical protein